MSKFSEKDVEQIISLYNDGKQQREVAKIFNCSQTLISQILIRNNIATRVGKKTIYNDINTDFFKSINCEESAYFLGFMYADGGVNTDNSAYTARLKLKSDDLYIIERFRDIMSPSSPIHKVDGGKYSDFTINRKEICDQLIALGCPPRKSLILEFPKSNIVPDHLLHHFIRGYSDGDGSIVRNYNEKRDYSSFVWKIVSTNNFCKDVANIIQTKFNIHSNISLSKPKSENKITHTLSIGGNNQCKTILDWLYKDATIYLPRKHQKYIELQSQIIKQESKPPINKRPDIDRDAVINDYISGMYLKQIAAKHNVSVWFVNEEVNKSKIIRRQK